MEGVSQFTTSQSRVNFFQERIVRMVVHWRDHSAVQQIEVVYLDKEREAILKAISLGLDFDPAWPVVKALVIAFTPYMERRGHWDAWHTILDRALISAQRLRDVDGETTLTALLARLSQRMSRPRDVVYHYRRAMRLARRTGNRYEEGRACSNLGYLYIDQGHWWRSEVLCQHALALFEELESDHGRAHTHNHLGVLYIRDKQWVKAEEHLTIACQLWKDMPDNHSLIYGLDNLAMLYIETRNPQWALAQLHEAVERLHAVGEEAEAGRIFTNFACAYRLKHEWKAAESYAQKAEDVFRNFSDRYGLAQVWHEFSMIYLQMNQREKAEYYVNASTNAHQQLGNTEDEIRLHFDLIEFYLRRNNQLRVDAELGALNQCLLTFQGKHKGLYEKRYKKYCRRELD